MQPVAVKNKMGAEKNPAPILFPVANFDFALFLQHLQKMLAKFCHFGIHYTLFDIK
jgi:hypothetical protein